MASVNIASSDNITGIRLKEQASSPTTPPSGYAQLYVNTTPAVQFEDDAGTVRTLSDTTHTHPTLTLTEQASAPATPASGFAQLYVDTTPVLKFKNDAGTVVTLSDTTHTHAASAITSGTLDNARVNWAAPSAIGGTTPAKGTFTNVDIDMIGAAVTTNLIFEKAGVYRNILQSTGTESGSNTGSDLLFLMRADDGTALHTALKITRATGVLTAGLTYSKTITSNVRDVQIDDSGVLGYVASARKHKHKIRPIKGTNRFIAKVRELNPVRYRYKVNGLS